jgi:hypothetical protein
MPFEVTWDENNKDSSITLSNEDRDAAATLTAWRSVKGTTTVSGGKYYFEIEVVVSAVGNEILGIGTPDAATNNYLGSDAYGWGMRGSNGYKYHNAASSAYGSAYGQGDVLGVAFDTIAGKVWFSVNGVWQGSGVPEAGTNPAYTDADIDSYMHIQGSPYSPGDKIRILPDRTRFNYSPPPGFEPFAYAGYFTGHVYEEGVAVSRTVHLNERSTGALMNSTTSSGDGYYYMTTTYSGTHYLVCLDNDAGIEYNDLIIGNVVPTTLSG